MLQRVKKSKCRSEIELRMSTILKFRYYGIPCNVKKIKSGDILRISEENDTSENL